MRTDDLIGRLAGNLRPVRRSPTPAVGALVWMMFAGTAVAAAVVLAGPREDLVAYLGTGVAFAQLSLSILAAGLAAFAAAMLALPDRDRRWVLLPLPAAAGWVFVLGWNCLADLIASGAMAFRVPASPRSFLFVASIGLPLALFLFWRLRHAVWFRPGPVSALCGVAGAALASAGQGCTQFVSPPLMTLAWHGLAIALVTMAVILLGPRLCHPDPPAG